MSTSSQPLDDLGVSATAALPPRDAAVASEVYAEVAVWDWAMIFRPQLRLRELFGDFTIDISVDPEIQRCSYMTFNVRNRESMESVLEKEWEWFRRVHWPTYAEGSFCLDVDFDK